jgi:hypothetical protein
MEIKFSGEDGLVRFPVFSEPKEPKITLLEGVPCPESVKNAERDRSSAIT